MSITLTLTDPDAAPARLRWRQYIRREARDYRRDDLRLIGLGLAYWWHDYPDYDTAVIARLKQAIRFNRRDTNTPAAKRKLRLDSLWFALCGEMIMAGRFIRMPNDPNEIAEFKEAV